MGMWPSIMNDNTWRPLLAGVLYIAVTLAGGWLSWGLTRWAHRWASPGAVRLRLWGGWRPLGRGSALLWAVGYPYGMLLNGTYAARDIGVGATDWPLAIPWALAIIAGAMTLLLVLWRGRWPRAAENTTAPTRISLLAGLVDVVCQEAPLVTLRASLVPLMGPYWGIWLAIAANWALLAADPWIMARWRARRERPGLVLRGALDWVSATLTVYTTSAWLSLAGRALSYAALMAQRRRIVRRATPAAADGLSPNVPDLLNDQGQDDQGSEHGRRQDGDVA